MYVPYVYLLEHRYTVVDISILGAQDKTALVAQIEKEEQLNGSPTWKIFIMSLKLLPSLRFVHILEVMWLYKNKSYVIIGLRHVCS